jgi:hypothetical protein
MQRWTALAFVAILIAFALGVVLSPADQKTVIAAAVSSSVGLELKDGGTPDATAHMGARVGVGDGGDAADSGARDEGSAAIEPLGGLTDAGGTLLDGTVPPALPSDVPKSVVFGVILVQYQGAQGAPPNARTRDAAMELAKKLAAEAKQDFRAAVPKGDKGSMDNLGRMPRGVLEPAPEYALFSLKKDGVSEPVDTPRGFWIVHRIE